MPFRERVSCVYADLNVFNRHNHDTGFVQLSADDVEMHVLMGYNKDAKEFESLIERNVLGGGLSFHLKGELLKEGAVEFLSGAWQDVIGEMIKQRYTLGFFAVDFIPHPCYVACPRLLDPRCFDIYVKNTMHGDAELAYVMKAKPGGSLQFDLLFASSVMPSPDPTAIRCVVSYCFEPPCGSRIRSLMTPMIEKLEYLNMLRAFKLRAEANRCNPMIVSEHTTAIVERGDGRMSGIDQALSSNAMRNQLLKDGFVDPNEDCEDPSSRRDGGGGGFVENPSNYPDWEVIAARHHLRLNPDQLSALRAGRPFSSVMGVGPGQSFPGMPFNFQLPTDRKLARQADSIPPDDIPELESQFRNRMLGVYGIPVDILAGGFGSGAKESGRTKGSVVNENAVVQFKITICKVRNEYIRIITQLFDLAYRQVFEDEIRLRRELEAFSAFMRVADKKITRGDHVKKDTGELVPLGEDNLAELVHTKGKRKRNEDDMDVDERKEEAEEEKKEEVGKKQKKDKKEEGKEEEAEAEEKKESEEEEELALPPNIDVPDIDPVEFEVRMPGVVDPTAMWEMYEKGLLKPEAMIHLLAELHAIPREYFNKTPTIEIGHEQRIAEEQLEQSEQQIQQSGQVNKAKIDESKVKSKVMLHPPAPAKSTSSSSKKK